MMMSHEKVARVRSLRACVQEDFFHHSYEYHYNWLRSLVISKLDSDASTREVLMFLGPARIGKTRILEALDLEFGKTRQEADGRRKDLLYVRIPEGGTAGSILGTILRTMGEPYPVSVKLDELRNRVRQRLLSTGVKIAVFDETQHMVDEGRKTAVRAASDFVKGLIEENPQVTFVFSGIPISAYLREQNPQLRGRCDKPVYYLPYNWAVPAQREQFACAVLAVHDVVTTAMPEGDAPDLMRFIQGMYLLGGGCFGHITNFVRGLANALEQDAQAEHLHHQHLVTAFERISRDAEYPFNPFSSDADITPAMLHQAWQLVMTEHGLQRFIGAQALVGATPS